MRWLSQRMESFNRWRGTDSAEMPANDDDELPLPERKSIFIQALEKAKPPVPPQNSGIKFDKHGLPILEDVQFAGPARNIARNVAKGVRNAPPNSSNDPLSE